MYVSEEFLVRLSCRCDVLFPPPGARSFLFLFTERSEEFHFIFLDDVREWGGGVLSLRRISSSFLTKKRRRDFC